MDSWSSKGYFYVLSIIPEKELKDEVSGRASKISTLFVDRHNAGLVVMVAAMLRNGQMERVVMQPSGHSQWDFTPLITSSGRTKQDAPQDKDSGTYNVTTCFIFHQLLIATLRAYGIALCELKKANHALVEAKKVVKKKRKKVKELMEVLVEKSNRVWICGNLLSQIASSRMLRQHLRACSPFLTIPTYDLRKRYRKFANFTVGDGGWSAPANADDPNDSAVDDIDLEGNEKNDEVFLKWVRLQASYWLDLSTLSRTFGSSNPAYLVPEIVLVAMKHPKDNIGGFPVENVKDTLKALISSGYPINVEAALTMILANGGGENVYDGTIHCEAALVVLIFLAHHPSAAEAMGLGPVNELLKVIYCVVIMLINLT